MKEGRMNEWRVSFHLWVTLDKCRLRLNWKLIVESECCKLKIIYTKQIYLKCNPNLHINLPPPLLDQGILSKTCLHQMKDYSSAEILKRKKLSRKDAGKNFEKFIHISSCSLSNCFICVIVYLKKQRERPRSVWKKSHIFFPKWGKFWFIPLIKNE